MTNLAVTTKEESKMDEQSKGLVLTIEEIQKLIPHRYPFLLVDRIEEIDLGISAVGIKNVSMNEWFFQGHFPDHPIMPGVLIIEALAQTAGALVIKSLQEFKKNATELPHANVSISEKPLVYFMSVESAKFRKPVTPGDVLKLKVVKERSHGTVWKFKGNAYVNEVLTSEASFTAMIVDKK